MKTIRKLLTAALLLALCLSLSACETYNNFYNTFFNGGDADEPSLRIGVFEPVTGQDSEAAAQEIAGIELAHKLYGSVLGCRVDLVYGDNQSDTELAAQVAQELIDKEVCAVLGSYKSMLSLAASDVFKSNRVPAIGITCTNPLITQTNDYYFRVCYPDSYEGGSAASYIYKGMDQAGAAVLKMAEDDYAQTIIEEFEKTMVKLTGDEYSVSVVEYPQGTENFTVYLNRLLNTGCSTVFFPSSPQVGAQVIRQAKAGGYTFDWIGTSRWQNMPASVADYGQDGSYYLDGVFYVQDNDFNKVETQMEKTFISEYKKLYGQDAEPSEAAALGFDAYLLALRGIEDAGSADNPAFIAVKLKSVYEMEGATGSISLNSQGDPIKDVTIEKVRKDSSTPVYTISPEWGE